MTPYRLSRRRNFRRSMGFLISRNHYPRSRRFPRSYHHPRISHHYRMTRGAIVIGSASRPGGRTAWEVSVLQESANSSFETPNEVKNSPPATRMDLVPGTTATISIAAPETDAGTRVPVQTLSRTKSLDYKVSWCFRIRPWHQSSLTTNRK